MALITWYMREHSVARSEAVRAIFAAFEMTLDPNARRNLSTLRVQLASAAREEQKLDNGGEPVELRCPSCGDKDLYVPLRDGRWRCDMCMASG